MKTINSTEIERHFKKNRSQGSIPGSLEAWKSLVDKLIKIKNQDFSENKKTYYYPSEKEAEITLLLNGKGSTTLPVKIYQSNASRNYIQCYPNELPALIDAMTTIMNSLKVLTWNVGIGTKGDSWEKEKVLGLINSDPYDAIFLQEVPVNGEKNQIKVKDFESLNSYHIIKSHEIVGNQKSKYIFITLIRNTVVVGDYFQIAEVRLAGPCKGYFPCALIATPIDEPKVAFVNVHLKSGQSDADTDIRKDQANAIGTYAKHFDQIILGGDFNCKLSEATALAKKMIDTHCDAKDKKRDKLNKRTPVKGFLCSYKPTDFSCPDHIFCHPGPKTHSHILETVGAVRGSASTIRGETGNHFHFPVETKVSPIF